jgi:DNA-binding MarR family transcriptional regulator
MPQFTDLKLVEAKPRTLSDLASFRLRLLANMYTKASASVYERKFGLTLNQWRIISLLWAADSLSMSRLAHQAQIDRGITSRVVGTLIDSGHVKRSPDPQDGRGLVLELTTAGRELVEAVMPVAADRNRQLLSCLTKKEAELFEGVLDKLTHQARIMLDIEREKAALAHQDDQDEDPS